MTDIVMPASFRLAGAFGKSVAIYGRRFVPFVVVTMIASIPGLILSVAVLVGGGTSLASSGASMAVAFLNAAATLFASGAVMYCVVEELRGRVSSLACSLRFLLQRLLPLLGVAMLTAIAMAWGVLMLPLWSHVGEALHGTLEHLLPGIEVAAVVDTISLALGIVVLLLPWCVFCLSMPVCLAEGAGVLASLSRSRRLTRGHRGKVFATLLVFTLAVLVLHSAFAGVLASTGDIGTLLVNAALGVVDSSVYGVLAGVLYYEIMLAKDAVDARFARVFD